MIDISDRLAAGIDIRSLHLFDDTASLNRFIQPSGTLSSVRVAARIGWTFCGGGRDVASLSHGRLLRPAVSPVAVAEGTCGCLQGVGSSGARHLDTPAQYIASGAAPVAGRASTTQWRAEALWVEGLPIEQDS